ncbi:MAG: PEP-CTERM sorting domain-containing protein [Burkholderiaceae bacterium]|nr:MAG: PEP-CTERM sorting domain-containing protein [Burkholderiaceae bacterium]
MNIQAKFLIASFVACMASFAPNVAAGVIQSPTSAVIDLGGPGFGSITNTLNQAGLSSGFVSGVTDFDTYIGTGPTHTLIFGCCEWFSNSGTTSATVTYNMGAAYNIARLALWNEESSGIGSLDLSTSLDGITFSTLALGLVPTDNPLADYPADVFSFATTSAQFIRFEMSGCPQALPGSFAACAIGEVAFDVVQGAQVVPEPASVILFGIGLFGFAAVRHKKKQGFLLP